MDTRGSKPEEPYFGFDLFRFQRRRKARRLTVGGRCGRRSKSVGSRCRISTDGRLINRNNIHRAVLETIAIFEI